MMDPLFVIEELAGDLALIADRVEPIKTKLAQMLGMDIADIERSIHNYQHVHFVDCLLACEAETDIAMENLKTVTKQIEKLMTKLETLGFDKL